MLKKRCVLFGGGGFIGSHLTQALVNNNYEVLVFSRGSRKDSLNLADLIHKITFIQGNIINTKLIKKIIKPGDYIFNLISSSLPITSMQNPSDEVKNHIYLNVILAQTVFKIGIKKYVFASTGGGIYGQKRKFPISESASIQPSSPHAIAKATIELYLNYFSRIYNIPTLIYRISNAYGPRQSIQTGFGIIPTIIDRIKNSSPLILFNQGKIIRDFIYIDDLTSAIISSFAKNTKYNLYNLGSGQGISIYKIWRILNKLLQAHIKPIYREKRPIDVDKVVLDITRFSKEFRWQPKFDIETGLKKILTSLTSPRG